MLNNNIDTDKQKSEVIICTLHIQNGTINELLSGIIPSDGLFLNGSRKLRIRKVSANLLVVKGSCKSEV